MPRSECGPVEWVSQVGSSLLAQPGTPQRGHGAAALPSCQDYAAEAVNLHKFFANRTVLYQQVVPDLETCLTHELKNRGT